MVEQQTITVAEALSIQVDQLRRLSLDINTDIARLGSLVSAFHLAAAGDESNGQRTLYWPDLMSLIEQEIPDTDTYDRRATAITDNLRQIALAAQQPDAQGAGTEPAPRAERATRAARSRRALAEHVAA